LLQYAQKVARRSRRSRINPDDVNQAFRHLNVEPIYGISNTSDPFRFVKLAGHAQVMRVSDPILPIDSVLQTPLPSPPWEAGLRMHWLAIDGRQPNVPENVQMLKPLRKPKRRKTDILAPEPEEQLEENKNEGDGGSKYSNAPGGVLVKAPLKHVLSRELTIYLDHTMSALEGSAQYSGDPKRLLNATLTSLRLDAGIQPLAPYVCYSLARNIWMELSEGPGDTAAANIDDKQACTYDPIKLNAYLRASECIASNRTLDLSWYLHELIPAIMEVILGVPQVDRVEKADRMKHFNKKYRWDQREYGAKSIASICIWYPEVAPRVQKQFVQGLRANPVTHLPTIYGSIMGITYQGERAVQTLILPNLMPLIRNLTSHAKSCSTRELNIVRDALLSAAGSLLRRRIDRIPILSVDDAISSSGAMKSPRLLFARSASEAPPTRQRNKPRQQKTRVARKSETPCNLEEMFSSQNEHDPCIMFSESEKSISSSLAWLGEYSKAHKAAMDLVSGSGEGRYHIIAAYKNSKGENEVKHLTAASHKTGANQLEVFPVSDMAYNAKILQKAYAEDPPPEEYYRLIHKVFGVPSDPYCAVFDDVFI
jgi:hypothetical protein